MTDSASPEGKLEVPTKRRRVDSQAIGQIASFLGTANEPKRRRSTRLVERDATNDTPTNNTRRDSSDKENEMQDDEGIPLPAEPATEASCTTPDDETERTRAASTRLKPEWNVRQAAAFSRSIRAVRTEGQSSSPVKPKDYRFTFGEHKGKTFEEVPFGFLLALPEQGHLEHQPGLKEAYEYCMHRKASDSGEPARGVAQKHPENYRIPDQAAATMFRGWRFKDIPKNYVTWLAYELRMGRLQDWDGLREAFEYHCPQELSDWKSSKPQSRDGGSASTKMPTGPRRTSHDDHPSHSHVKEELQEGGISLSSLQPSHDPFCLGPEYFTFPPQTKYAYKKFNEAPEQYLEQLANKLRRGVSFGGEWSGLREAFMYHRPDIPICYN